MLGLHPGSWRRAGAGAAILLVSCGPAAQIHAASGSAPAPTPVASISPTPFRPATPTLLPPAHAVTAPGCCVHPWWTQDSRSILFVDRPSPEGEAGVYRVPLDGGTPELSAFPLGLYASDGALLALPGGDEWTLARPDGAPGWHLPSAALTFRLSHDGKQVAWSEGSSLPVNVDQRQRNLWVADVDGGHRVSIGRWIGGDLIGWAGGDERLLVTGRPAGKTQVGIWAETLAGDVTLLYPSDGLRGVSLSPDGGWLAFLVAFTEDPASDGMWLLSTGDGRARQLDSYGSYRWRSEGRLLLLPYAGEGAAPPVVEVEASTGDTHTLLAPGALTGGVGNNEWVPSPDGRWIVYLNAIDRDLWVAALPK